MVGKLAFEDSSGLRRWYCLTVHTPKGNFYDLKVRFEEKVIHQKEGKHFTTFIHSKYLWVLK